MNNILAFNEQVWLPAVYNGRRIKNMVVSNYGWFRRYNADGVLGQCSRGTPCFNRNDGRLNQYMVTITFADPIKGQPSRTTVNLHRVLCCTFKGDVFAKGDDVKHKDYDVSNGFVGTAEKNYTDGNLVRCTHDQNMKNIRMAKPKTNFFTPVASAYGYRMKLTLGVKRIADLPLAYRREYRRLQKCERAGFPAIPSDIHGREVVRK